LRNLIAGVKRLAHLGMVPEHVGMAALDMNTAEDAIVNNTREVVPGMVMTGMELAEVRKGVCGPVSLCIHGLHSWLA
jgi:ribulose 1,5-bisphosphate synthetase/thiazole synthase